MTTTVIVLLEILVVCIGIGIGFIWGINSDNDGLCDCEPF